MFRSADDAEKFLARVQDVRTMAQTPSDILRGSPTAARMAEDAANRGGFEATANAMHVLAGALSGHPHAMLGALGRSGRAFMNTPDVQAVNDAIVRLALDPSLQLNTQAGANLLRQRPLPQVQRSLAVRRSRPLTPFITVRRRRISRPRI
jgi:hypothetical protein